MDKFTISVHLSTKCYNDDYLRAALGELMTLLKGTVGMLAVIIASHIHITMLHVNGLFKGGN